eukprot:1851339-Pleurochrysis_carterae.AAC.1
MDFLAELMDVAHVQAGGGIAAAQPAFGLVRLARTACVAGGGAVRSRWKRGWGSSATYSRAW